MRTMFALLLLASVAAAQPPGQTAPISAPSVMDRRWSVEASVGPLGLKPKGDDAKNVTFGMLEIAGRFRIRSWIDVGVSFHGAGSKDDLSTGGVYIDGRYRFLAERSWNVFALLSLGIVSVARDDASDDAKKGRGTLRIGAGVERRFARFGIHAELRLVTVGENKEFEPTATDLSTRMAKSELNGGSLTFGGTFYF